jgi:S1-C subfamily serine protease
VQSVPAASQAASDGFKPIDVILQLNGNPVTSLVDLNLWYGKVAAGQTMTLGVHRNQADTTLTITR